MASIFTGERFIPDLQGEIRLEHFHRYALASELIRGKSVLDLACGEGYGSFMLSEFAKSVLGVDISSDAISHAQKKYGSKSSNLVFKVGSASSLPLGDKEFDVVISFETIEHLHEQGAMLSEIRRVLKPNGILLISSPNKPIYSKNGNYHNHFHVNELDFTEFDNLLKKQFKAVEYFGQRLQIGSVIQSLETSKDVFRVWGDDGKSINRQAGPLPRPVYYIAVCADSNAYLPEICPSVLYPTQLDLLDKYLGYAKWAKAVDEDLKKAQQLLEIKEQEHHKNISWNQALEQELNIYRGLYQSLASRHERAEGINPRKAICRWINFIAAKTNKYLINLFLCLKRGYQRLPFSYVTRYRHKVIIAKLFPWALNLSNTSNLYAPIARTRAAFFSSDTTVDFSLPTSSDPIVSVIVPIYGKVEFTLACLRSIAKYPPKIAFEVVVVDDCSPDDSKKILAQVKGLNLYSNKENNGFIKSCNKGAHLSKGKYVYFLNNDTEVTEGWLDNLYNTFTDLSGTGLVGSRLLYPDGTLQEAGGIIWRDGSAWNYGKGQDANLPAFNYAREVDYCSGASIMLPRNIFEEMGGFDEHYAPAYCEDSDLALKIRRSGYRVIYQPTSTIIHYEGISSGTNIEQGVKAYQNENSKKLFERWKEYLNEYQPNAINIDDAKDRAFKKRVLVIDHCTPAPNEDAGSVTVVNTLILLRELGFQVTFIPDDNFLYMQNETVFLQKIGIEVLYAPFVKSVKDHVREFGGRYDLVFLFRPAVVGRHIKVIQKYCLKAKTIFHTVDLHFLRMSREATLKSDKSLQAAADKMKALELLSISSVDAVIVHSQAEIEILRPLVNNASLYLFPLILDISVTHKGFKGRYDILFLGGFAHAPNVDAVHFFVQEIMPILRKKIPGIRFLVAGSKAPPDILALSCEDIIILGYVADLSAQLDNVRVSVAPLRYGAGIKGKVGTAMACGLPVVATAIAAEGMQLSDGKNILLADSPEDFAHKVSLLYCDEELWKRISSNALNFAEETWGGEAALDILSKILRDLGIGFNQSNRKLNLYRSSK